MEAILSIGFTLYVTLDAVLYSIRQAISLLNRHILAVPLVLGAAYAAFEAEIFNADLLMGESSITNDID
ncbi:hypothetical protein AT864_01270 [Anoxybacillus sp. P3H1B]|uniref:hypothetical protein n=1 Tax=Anoxybacillus sp. P3H1B TaxID=1769293 RepID=UPI0007920A05|nr:hypothetical protein [Anoxybacillus sp. P3H1B]KXG10679.1 hypothetical protein AT864_01270 [Anoxybacillus sp. P3H1B]